MLLKSAFVLVVATLLTGCHDQEVSVYTNPLRGDAVKVHSIDILKGYHSRLSYGEVSALWLATEKHIDRGVVLLDTSDKSASDFLRLSQLIQIGDRLFLETKVRFWPLGRIRYALTEIKIGRSQITFIPLQLNPMDQKLRANGLKTLTVRSLSGDASHYAWQIPNPGGAVEPVLNALTKSYKQIIVVPQTSAQRQRLVNFAQTNGLPVYVHSCDPELESRGIRNVFLR